MRSTQFSAPQLDALRFAAHPLRGTKNDHDALFELIGDAHFVLLGEASHGTHEFYRERANITRRLIAEKAFDAVAIEGDWPDSHRVNRFVRAAGDDMFATDALAGFKRFPTWMWRNTDVVDFIDWLRAFNETRPVEAKTGFYGLDLYSLHGSMEAVLGYLDKTDPDAARRARALCLLRPVRRRQPGLRPDGRSGLGTVVRAGSDRDAGRYAAPRRDCTARRQHGR